MGHSSTKKEMTKYPGVRYHGETLYYRVILANGRRTEIKFGRGSPRDAFRAKEVRQSLEDQIRSGIINAHQQETAKHAVRPLSELVSEYIDHLKAKNDNSHHIQNTQSSLEECFRICRFRQIMDIDPQQVNQWLSHLDRSARTKNAKRSALLGFCRWAFEYGRSIRNLLPGGLMIKYDEDADRRRLSRAMTLSESSLLFTQMLDPNKMFPSYKNSSAIMKAVQQRRVFYLLAANTGLRWREIARLRWQDIHLDQALVIVPAGQTKNGKEAELPLVTPVIDALREIRPINVRLSEKVFSGEPRLKTWKRDLHRVGLLGKNEKGYRDERDRQLDRKCLRMSFCTWLKEAGVDLRDAQKFMRHSDPKLTSNIYTDIRLSGLRAAAQAVQQLHSQAKPH
jgi:integrase